MSADPCGYNSHLIRGSVFSRWWAGRNRRVSAGLPSCSGVDMVRKKGLSERRRRVVEAVKRLREIVAEAWNASEPEYVPPPGLNPGLGVAQIVPRAVREGDLLPVLVDVGEMLCRFVASQAADFRRRRAEKRLLAGRGGLWAGGDVPGGTLKQLARLLPPTGADPGTARVVRFAQERRKVCRRSTHSPCPTPEQIRAACEAAGRSAENRLQLGRLLMDLECYVDNDLVVRWYRKRPKIVARHPGIRGWLAEHCPELSPRYKTLMRYKSLATRARQEAGWTDTAAQASYNGATEFVSARVSSNPPRAGRLRIQPRRPAANLPRRYRFAWEHGSLRIDADGRFFLTNENYTRAAGTGRLLDWPGEAAGASATGYSSHGAPTGMARERRRDRHGRDDWKMRR